ncbi:metal ABC transporter solute-binding protein, Zn/Mn family [Halarcobacter ebronensis]|uniref:Cation ABC transporter substrate-binding protein n=1 Tax=Halarcobacter ebronensis TaxID=1462615 RepID=A0A4Q1APL3_9BACT|nr:zinc ABC transporter substrate-binding protein [Halarcobacter ebronensis]QKF81329.1 metal ion ABC transporter, periplasmic metal-binding protein [Halarcobacter ebronensis]RXK04893.1 cation ABC transporter substrate-binding protein [Halarcobacter ebronensis]
MKLILTLLVIFSTFAFANEVTVSILPQKYFVEKIAKDKMKVNVMVQPGSSPATYEPKTSQMKNLSKSLAYFSIGVPFEKAWLDRFENANKTMLMVDTSKGIEKLAMAAHHHEDEHEHEHEHEKEHHEKDEPNHDEHEHSGLDPHVWLDPILVKTQAQNIYETLVKIDAKNSDFYKKNLDSFLLELDNLNEKIASILKDYDDKAFMVFHPSWGYFSKRYHLEQISIEIQGKEPKPAQLIELVEEAQKHNIKIVFVAPQFSQKGAKTISKSINGNVAVIDPLSEKWDENLIKVANEIAKSYK